MSDEPFLATVDPGPSGMDFDEAHLQFDGWRSDWENAPRDRDRRGQDPRFLVRMKDGSVTTGYFYWYTEGGDGDSFQAVAFWALHDEVRDEPLDDCSPIEGSGLMWRHMPSGPWAENLTNFEKVGVFNRKFNLPIAGVDRPDFLDSHAFEFRSDFIREEHVELVQAHHDRDLVGVADALGDLLYVVYGMAHFYGIPLDRVFDAIHAKNMTKVRATDPSASKRGTALDVVKPVGFVGPEDDIRKILEDVGYDG